MSIAVNSPEQLRTLSPEQLPEVCDDLRHTLIQELSQNPGHFASSMGAVEIAVALHYVYNTPYDRIVWDVGHQAYAHKLLTGRRERFATNRRLGGLCGFPNPAESEYDTFTAGHASNSISAALGMSIASQLKIETPRRNVVAVIGDASISGGLAFEGLNNVANTPNNVLIILNDNEMSIDHNVGSLSRYLSRLNTSRRYNNFRYKTYKLLRKLGLINENSRGPIMRFTNSIKALVSRQQNIFEGLNIRYFGPFDGNDVQKLVSVLNDIKNMDGPKLLHLRTRKGAGYAPAEADPANWHAPGKFDPATGQRCKSANAQAKWQDVFGETLTELARHDDKIVGITAAMLSGTSVSAMAAEFPNRVFDVGISEGHAVTFAGGLAKDGMKPFVAIYSSFLQRGYDQIFHDVALAHLPVTFCIDRAGIVGEDGATHHGALDLAYLHSIAGITIAAPSDAGQLRQLMTLAAKRADGPFAIRYPRGTSTPSESENSAIEFGRGKKIIDGTDITILTVGPLKSNALKAVELLKEQGISAVLCDMIFIRPLDETILREVAAKGAPIITVEDGIRNGGFGSAVTEWLADNDHSGIKVSRLGLPTETFVTHGTPEQLYQLCGLDPQSIADAAKSLL
ncbi:MAG: 1-deoxy-D-xylulose-5-phosphate synthase [Bacteroides sp.]|nr:1-deoxy-D-xylulose-5-phosphate synthase [Bacteroides sp.]MCM1379891.1 1-deoxy-D-xylulose-5-phosphate synthase [Bacteroides sp.]MCM1446255.1 1-deoxy-D-xylulose-5-phosphate synthase [Prevotella sp.]